MSRDSFAWPWCNLADNQRRPYCTSVKSHYSVGASQSAVRGRYLSLCSAWLSYSQISSLSTAITALGNARSRREPNLGCRGWGWGLTDLGDVMLCQKSLHESCKMGRRIVVMKLICSLGHCKSDGHTVHKLTQLHCRLTSPTGEWRFTDAQ